MRVLIVSEGRNELDGALETLVRRSIGPKDVLFETDKISRAGIGHIHGKGQRLYKKVLAWFRHAERQGFNAIVLLTDRDGDPSRVPAMDNAQASDFKAIPRACGIAIESFDAWMLADEKALSHVLGCTVQRQPDPETMPDAKSSCITLIDNSPRSLGLSLCYLALTEALDLDQLATRCPNGFQVFANRLKQLNTL